MRLFVSASAFLVLIFFPLSAGCAGSQNQDTLNSGSPDRQTEAAPEALRRVTLAPSEVDPNAEPCALRRVYFELDSTELDDPSRDAIQSAVQCFRRRSTPARLRLTGATDPRGTEEYNIALGDRRGQAVREYLLSLGVNAERISVVSVGEEFAEGTDEGGWHEDRNVTTVEE